MSRPADLARRVSPLLLKSIKDASQPRSRWGYMGRACKRGHGAGREGLRA